MRKLITILVICIPALFVKGQTRTLGGRVIDESGNGISYASIKIQGAALGIAADASGNFKLPVSDSTTEIVVSATGFKPQTVGIKGLDTVIVTLARDAKALSDRVVISGGSRSAGNVTRSTTDGVEIKRTQEIRKSVFIE